MSKEVNKIRIYDTNIIFKNNTENGKGYDHNYKHYQLFEKLIKYLYAQGFSVNQGKYYDNTVDTSSYVGKKQELEFESNKTPSGFKIEFFQNINREHPLSGKYDYNKFKKMPYLTKQKFKLIKSKIIEFIKQEEDFLIIDDEINYKTAEDRIKSDFVECWHHEQKDMNFNLSDLDGTTCEQKANALDKAKKTILNGQIKYFRDYKGRLQRGKVYYNINNMWWVIINDTDYANICARDLFDIKNITKEDRKISRLIGDSIIKEKLRTDIFYKFFSYADIQTQDVYILLNFIIEELNKRLIENPNSIQLNVNLKTFKFENGIFKSAFIEVDGTYFSAREGISFNNDEKVGFCGWASSYNSQLYYLAFFNWIKHLKNKKEFKEVELNQLEKEIKNAEIKLNLFVGD